MKTLAWGRVESEGGEGLWLSLGGCLSEASLGRARVAGQGQAAPEELGLGPLGPCRELLPEQVFLKPCTSDWDLNAGARTRTQPKPRLGLEPTWPGLKPGQNPDWDLNACGRDSNPAKTHSLPTEITHLVSGLNEAQVLFVVVYLFYFILFLKIALARGSFVFPYKF